VWRATARSGDTAEPKNRPRAADEAVLAAQSSSPMLSLPALGLVPRVEARSAPAESAPRQRPVRAWERKLPHHEKGRPLGPASSFWLAGLARPAGKAELALTWRTVTLVIAPEEHPLPVGLRSKRAARIGHEPTWVHATPVTEALHVPLHLERSCCAAPA